MKVTRFIAFIGCVGLVSVALYFWIAELQAVWPFTIDDMYITLHYAKHWFEVGDLIWNLGETPLEGYSNFSFVALGRLAFALQINPVWMLKMSGVMGMVALGCGLFLLSRLWVAPRFAWIPVVWLLSYRGQLEWGVSGLETACYEALVVFAIYFLLVGMGYRQTPKPRLSNYNWFYVVLSSLCWFIASLTRPEAPLLLMLCLMGLMWDRYREHRSWFACGVMPGVFALLYTPYLVWKWYYFGRIWPNPIYCKGWIDVANTVLDVQYLRLAWPFAGFAMLAAWKMKSRLFYFLWAPSVLYLLLCLGADPIVAFDNRLFLPAFALLLPMALCGMLSITEDNKGVYGLALLMMLFIPMLSLKGYRAFTENPQSGERLRHQVVHWLSEHTSIGDTVVLADSGLIPYHISRHFVDSYCLNNKSMTEAPRAKMFTRFCQQIWQQQPKVFILTALHQKNKIQYTPADACLIRVLADHPQDYQPTHVCTPMLPDKTRYCYTMFKHA